MAQATYQQALQAAESTYQTGNPGQAARIFQAAEALDKKPVEALFGRAKSMAKLGRWQEALSLLDQCRQMGLESPLVSFLQGLCLWEQGDAAQAFELLNAAFHQDQDLQGRAIPPQDKRLLLTLLHEYRALENRLALAQEDLQHGRFLAGMKQVQKILALNPNLPQARAWMDQLVYGGAYPKQVVIEPTNKCSMGCAGCFTRAGSSIGVGFMTPEQFQGLMDELGPHLSRLILHDRGDSFHHPEIIRFLEITARYPHMQTIIHTHGSLDMDAEAVVRSGGLHELTFSIDGASQQTYQQYRRNGDLERVLGNLKAVLDAKRRLGKQYPVVVWKFIVMKTNEHEMEQAQQMARELGVDRFEFSQFGISWNGLRHLKNLSAYLDKFVPTDKEWLNVDYQALCQGVIKPRAAMGEKHCFTVNLNKPAIRWNGDVTPCCVCVDPYPRVMGNVFQGASFKEIWDSEKFRRWRKQAVLDPDRQEPCRQCHIAT